MTLPAGFSGIHSFSLPQAGLGYQGSPPGTVTAASSGHLPEPFRPPVGAYLFGLFFFIISSHKSNCSLSLLVCGG